MSIRGTKFFWRDIQKFFFKKFTLVLLYGFLNGLSKFRFFIVEICILIRDFWKEKKIFLINKEIQKGSGAKSYMRKGFLIYEEKRIYLFTYEETVSQIWLCTRSLLNFLYMRKIFFYFFISVTLSLYCILRNLLYSTVLYSVRAIKDIYQLTISALSLHTLLYISTYYITCLLTCLRLPGWCRESIWLCNGGRSW